MLTATLATGPFKDVFPRPLHVQIEKIAAAVFEVRSFLESLERVSHYAIVKTPLVASKSMVKVSVSAKLTVEP